MIVKRGSEMEVYACAAVSGTVVVFAVDVGFFNPMTFFATGSASLSGTISPSASSQSPEEEAISDASSTEIIVGSSLAISASSASFSSDDAVLRGGVGPAVNSRSSSGVSSGRGMLSGATASDADTAAGTPSSAGSTAASSSFPSRRSLRGLLRGCPFSSSSTTSRSAALSRRLRFVFGALRSLEMGKKIRSNASAWADSYMYEVTYDPPPKACLYEE
ncbi:hypothetical protein BJ912DRAFT_969121 [Pholiota molesta]|nr:hypothetical protein BJ912DRAFT_969121 [Pholiota molesta]